MRRAVGITWISLALMCLYLAWIFISRWSANRALLRSLEESKAAQNRAVVEKHGGGRLAILGFYASRTIVGPGESAQLCYSVANAKTVRIEPPVKDVWPSLSRCVDVTPDRDTVYRLVAEDSNGNTTTAAVTVQVR